MAIRDLMEGACRHVVMLSDRLRHWTLWYTDATASLVGLRDDVDFHGL